MNATVRYNELAGDVDEKTFARRAVSKAIAYTKTRSQQYHENWVATLVVIPPGLDYDVMMSQLQNYCNNVYEIRDTLRQSHNIDHIDIDIELETTELQHGIVAIQFHYREDPQDEDDDEVSAEDALTLIEEQYN